MHSSTDGHTHRHASHRHTKIDKEVLVFYAEPAAMGISRQSSKQMPHAEKKTCLRRDLNPGPPILTVFVTGANHCVIRPPTKINTQTGIHTDTCTLNTHTDTFLHSNTHYTHTDIT